MSARRARRYHYSVYVIELSKDVLNEPRFRKANERYRLHLVPRLYEMYNPMPYDAARDMEVELAIALRDKGYGVWQG